MKTIKVRKSHHEGQDVLKIFFDYEPRIKDYIKSWKGRWFPPGKYWWVSASRIKEDRFIDGLNKLGRVQFDRPVDNHIDPSSTNSASNRVVGKLVESIKNEEHKKKVELVILHMRRTRYSENTIQTYIALLVPFLNLNHQKSITDLSIEDVHLYNDEEIIQKQKSNSTQRQFIGAVKIFGKITGGLKFDPYALDTPRKEKKLPVVLSIDECYRIIDHPKNLKHKFILAMLYSCGLRIGELTDMRLDQLDLNRRKVHVVSGKGNKDRTVGLSPNIVPMAREYLSQFRPQVYVLEGKPGKMYSQSSIRNILKRAVKDLRINKSGPIHPHTLRHSYATHMVEAGLSVVKVKELLGHNSLKTTMIYLHLARSASEEKYNPFNSFKHGLQS